MKINLRGRFYYLTMILLPAISIVVKNIIFQAFILGKNMYEVNIVEAIRETRYYWVFYLAITMLILSVTMLIKSDKNKIIYIFSVDIVVTVLLYTDLIYSRSFYTVPSVVNLAMVTNLTGAGADSEEIISLFSGYDILLLLDFVALIIFVIVFRKKVNDIQKERRYLNFSFGVVLLFSMVILLMVPVKAVITRNKTDFEEIYGADDADDIAKHFGTVGFHINDIYRTVKEKYFPKLTEKDKKNIEAFYEWKNSETGRNSQYAMFKGKNIIFFQIESLESCVINEKINGREITPNINRLLKNSYYFPKIYEEVQCGNSSDADLMYTSGMLPATKGCTFYRYENVELDSFPKRLSAQGYYTEYFQAIDGKFWNYEKALTGMIGIDKFYGKSAYEMDETIGFTLADRSFLNQTYKFLSDSMNKKNKIYAHIVCNSSHMPFQIEPQLSDLGLDKSMSDSYFGGYVNGINYVDKCIGEFIDMLEKDGRLNNTVIVIAGDHTGLHKYYEHKIQEYYEEYPWLNVEGEYTVPLIIYNPDISDRFEAGNIGGQIDVMPTMAYLFGEEFGTGCLAMGKNLFITKRNMALFRNGEVIGENISEEDSDILKKAYGIADILFAILN